MAVLLWDNGHDQGAFEFGEGLDSPGQGIGRDCFPGSPKWMPSKVFSIYPVEGKWVIFLADHYEWLRAGLKPLGAEWIDLYPEPLSIGDDTLIVLDHAGANYRFIFHSVGRSRDYTNPLALWDSEIWRGYPKADYVNGRIAVGMAALDWLAGYLKRHQWYGVIALGAALLLAIAPSIPKIIEKLPHPPTQKAILDLGQ